MPPSRKRQARLSFTPLPSSSPAAKGYHKQIQDRAAAVTIRGSPAKRRKLHHMGEESGQLDGANDSMPTPAATLERGGNRTYGTGMPENEDDSDDVPLVPTQRDNGNKRRKTSRQQPLDFSNTRDSDSFDAPVKLSSSAKAQGAVQNGMFSSQRRRATVISSDEESDPELPSPAKIATKTRKLERGRRSKLRGLRETRNTRRSSQLEPESEEGNVAVSSPQQLPLEVESEDEEDEMPSTMATQRRKRGRKQASPDSFISSSPPPLGPIDSDDDVEIIEKPKRQRRGGRQSDSESQSGEDDDEPKTPGRRKLKRPRKLKQQEEDDLAEDLDFLGPSSDAENSARKPRNTQNAQKSARQSALEKLKRKRSTQPGPSQPIVVDDDDEDDDPEEEDSEQYEEGEEDDQELEDAQPLPMSSRQYFTANEQDEDFIEAEDEAEGGTLGRPDHNIPIQFTHYARMKPKELFEYAVEWMVQKKINPAFTMDDELYTLTFRKLDDEVKGLAGSKFTSAAWTEQFTYALRARPDIAYEPLDRSGEHYMNDHCDACNRSGHPATYRIQFQGKPYYRETLEEINTEVEGEDSDSDSDSDSDDQKDDEDNTAAWDSDGREIVPVTHVFFVGKFCMGNAQTAHALQHWRYHLNEWVVNWLSKNGYLTAPEIVKRDGWSEKKRGKAAIKIAKRMEREGVVQKLWREFRGNIDDARNSKQGRF